MEVVSDILKQLQWSPAAKKALHNIVHERMQEAGLSPYTFTYGIIINCLGKADNLVAVLRIGYSVRDGLIRVVFLI